MKALARLWPSSIAVLASLAGGFFLGFYHCGAPVLPRELTAAGMLLVIAVCCATQFFLKRQISLLVALVAIVFSAYLVGGSLGWVYYASPSNAGEFVKEFVHGWQGGCQP
jgi:asparagine N-glycosylation enzyme membrane subunit Stt3